MLKLKFSHFVFAFLLILSWPQSFVFADNTGLGVGILIGKPIAVTGKYKINDTLAVDLGLGGSGNSFSIYSDVLFLKPELFPLEEAKATGYIGVGERILADTNFNLGIGVPLGISCSFDQIDNFEIFAELVPVFYFGSTKKGDINGGLGARFYF